mmetsp:Transcript_17521/g.24373  ORF Transcript_17521/g.24373 Transcript_17521/m.24373 type:complete len:135 (+) Transcript_17521:34-438(+)
MAMESFSTANSLFVDECFEDALSHYSKAIELAGEDCPPDYFTKRSFTHFKLKNFTEAVGDASTAIAKDPTSAIAYQRKGMACFALEEYEAAKEAFLKAQQTTSNPSSQIQVGTNTLSFPCSIPQQVFLDLDPKM